MPVVRSLGKEQTSLNLHYMPVVQNLGKERTPLNAVHLPVVRSLGEGPSTQTPHPLIHIGQPSIGAPGNQSGPFILLG